MEAKELFLFGLIPWEEKIIGFLYCLASEKIVVEEVLQMGIITQEIKKQRLGLSGKKIKPLLIISNF